MSSIVIASVPAHGHITPMLAVAERFVERGDDVRFVTGSRYADKVAATGATFVSLPAEADFDFEQLSQRFPERAKLKGLKAIAFDVENVFAGPAKAQYETLMAAMAAQPADAVLAEPAFFGAAFHTRAPTPNTAGGGHMFGCPAAHRQPRHRALRHGVATGPSFQPSAQHRTGGPESPGCVGGPIKASSDQYR